MSSTAKIAPGLGGRFWRLQSQATKSFSSMSSPAFQVKNSSATNSCSFGTSQAQSNFSGQTLPFSNGSKAGSGSSAFSSKN